MKLCSSNRIGNIYEPSSKTSLDRSLPLTCIDTSLLPGCTTWVTLSTKPIISHSPSVGLTQSPSSIILSPLFILSLLISHSDSSGSDRKSTRLNSSHVRISYAVFCLKKKKQILDARLGIFSRPLGSTNTDTAARPSEKAPAFPLPERGAAAGLKISGRQFRVEPFIGA